MVQSNRVNVHIFLSNRTIIHVFLPVAFRNIIFILSSLIDRYFHWNGTSVAYPNKTISTTQSLVSWAQNQISNTFVTWIGTSGRKSLNLSNRLESNSRYSLLVFLERKPRYVIVISSFYCCLSL